MKLTKEVEAGSTAAGARWAASWRDDLRKQGRPASGGWPGTLSEARAQVAAIFVRDALTLQERELAARAVYAAARRDWLSHEEPEPAE